MMYTEFEKWLNAAIESGLSDGEGLCFNIYEEGNHTWAIELVIASAFDPEDDDWASETIYSSESLFTYRQVAEWDDVLEDAIQVMLKYLNEGKYSDELKNKFAGISTGFVDGDLEHLYIKE